MEGSVGLQRFGEHQLQQHQQLPFGGQIDFGAGRNGGGGGASPYSPTGILSSPPGFHRHCPVEHSAMPHLFSKDSIGQGGNFGGNGDSRPNHVRFPKFS